MITKCPNCGYEWESKSKLDYVTCPNCQRKFKDILKIVSDSRYSFTTEMVSINPDFNLALNCCRGLLNVLAGKLTKEVIMDLNKEVYKIEKLLPKANQTFIQNKEEYWKYPDERKEVRKLLENLWREIEKIQNKYNYGMIKK